MIQTIVVHIFDFGLCASCFVLGPCVIVFVLGVCAIVFTLGMHAIIFTLGLCVTLFSFGSILRAYVRASQVIWPLGRLCHFGILRELSLCGQFFCKIGLFLVYLTWQCLWSRAYVAGYFVGATC